MNTTTSILIDNYDYYGAAMYIAVILIWYSIGLVLMLFFHVRARTVHNEFRLDDYETTNQLTPATTTNPFADYYHIQADNTQKQILNELKDPERRQRLWKIYYSSTEKENEPHPRYYQTITADSATIGRINRKLATIHRTNERDDSTNDITNSFFSKRFNPIRRSSGSPMDTNISTVRTRSGSDSFTTTTYIKDNSKKRNNKFFTRFTVESVTENK